MSRGGEPGTPRPAPSPAPCPICGAPVAVGEPARPFCSGRCKMVDLGRWFTEAYRVPGEDAVAFGGPAEEEPPGRDD